MAERIGLFGGTFDPPHLGHLALAQEACCSLNLQRVFFVPAAHNPLKGKSCDDQSSEIDRMEMVRLAIAGNSLFETSEIEIERGGESYTIDTLRSFAQTYSPENMFLLMGADSASTLASWKDVSAYGGLCTLAIANRSGDLTMAGELTELLEYLGLKYVFLSMPPIGVSSSELRRRVSSGLPVRYFVPDPVAELIEEKQLYR